MGCEKNTVMSILGRLIEQSDIFIKYALKGIVDKSSSCHFLDSFRYYADGVKRNKGADIK